MSLRFLAALPFIGILLGVPFVNRVEPLVLGMPFVLAWIVLWVVLISVIMGLIYRLDPATVKPAPKPKRPGHEQRPAYHRRRDGLSRCFSACARGAVTT